MISETPSHCRLSLCMVCSLTAFLVLSLSAHADVEIRAYITVHTFEEDNGDGELRKRHGFDVVCVAGQDRWRIDTAYLRGADSAWLYDGTNLFEAIRLRAPVSERLRDNVQTRLGFATVPFEVARSNLTINVHASTDGNPHGHLGVNLPWSAFCSGTYLRRTNRLIGLPDAILRHAPDGFAYTDNTKTFADEFGLPATVELFTSKSLYETSVQRQQFRGKRDVNIWRDRIASFPDGALKFRYSVTASTNFLGRTFPLEFEFVHNEQRQDGTWFAARLGKGIVRSLRESMPPEHVFNPSLQQTIVDYRFTDPANPNDALVYQSTNSFLPAILADARKMIRSAGPK
jgi:hypothetical protein